MIARKTREEEEEVVAGIYPLVRFHRSFHPEDGQRQCLVTWRSPQLCTFGYLSRRENSFGRNAIDRRIREKEKKREARGQPEKREDNGKTEYWLRHVHRPRERHLRQEKSLIDV